MQMMDVDGCYFIIVVKEQNSKRKCKTTWFVFWSNSVMICVSKKRFDDHLNLIFDLAAIG